MKSHNGNAKLQNKCQVNKKLPQSSNFVLVFEKQPIKALYSVYKQSYSNVKLRFTTSDYTLVS